MCEPTGSANNFIQVASLIPKCGDAFAHLLTDAGAKIVDDFLRDRLWLVFRSRHEGRMSVGRIPLERRLLYGCGTETEIREAVRSEIEKAVAEHAAYWHSKVWC